MSAALDATMPEAPVCRPLPPTASPFAVAHDHFVDAGYPVVPIMPGSKVPGAYKPGVGYYKAGGWQTLAVRPADAAQRARQAAWPGAGIGVVLGFQVGEHIVICLDWDTTDPEELAALSALVPHSPMTMIAARGKAALYRADPSVSTKAYKIDGRGVLDRLARRRQKVCPPSGHPSGVDYRYEPGCGLTPAAELPILTAEHLEAVEAALEARGWQRGTATAEAGEVAAVDAAEAYNNDQDIEHRVNRDLNNRALACFDKWVPALEMPKTERKRGGGYVAVAAWRPSSTGKPLEEREPHLSFDPSGICDWGDGEKGYTAIDVVMHALGYTSNQAFCWLAHKDRVGELYGNDHPEVAPFLAAMDEKDRLAAEERLEARAEALMGTAAAVVQPVEAPASVFTWDDRDANAVDEHEWLVREILSRKGASMIWGQSGVGKGFVTLELTACIASGQPFFGNKVKLPGGVLLALGENVGSIPLRMKALDIGRLRPDDPTDPVTSEPMDTKRLPVVWFEVASLNVEAKFLAFAQNLRLAKVAMVARHGRPLRIVILDTLNAAFQFPEDADTAVATNAMKKLGDLGRELDLLILAVHHAGKSYEAGETGSHAWRAGCEESIGVYGVKHPITGIWSERRVILVKARDGTKEGWNSPFDLRSVDLGVNKDDEPVSSAIAVPGEGIQGDNDNEPRMINAGTRLFLEAVKVIVEHASVDLVREGSVEPVRVANMRDVRTEYRNRRSGQKLDTVDKAFRRGLEDAKSYGHVETFEQEGEKYALIIA